MDVINLNTIRVTFKPSSYIKLSAPNNFERNDNGSGDFVVLCCRYRQVCLFDLVRRNDCDLHQADSTQDLL
jgi:hypothetical protein